MTENIKIEIPHRIGLPAVSDIFDWSEENNINIKNQKVRLIPAETISGCRYTYIFSFDNEDDAAAFKLRWL